MLETHDIETGPHPRTSLIVLHGLGDSGHGWVPIAQELDLRSVGAVRMIFPHAPERPVTINGGYRMRAWYDILGTELVRREDEAGLRESQAEVAALIDREQARGVPAERIVVMGFSQGCAMALMTAVRYPQRLAGAVALSGYLPLAATTAAERHAANAGLPIFMAHGSQDPVVPLQRGADSREALLRLGYPVQWHSYPMPHSVCEPEIADLNAWLLQQLA
jgi:phospholipase/carboxylesterase